MPIIDIDTTDTSYYLDWYAPKTKWPQLDEKWMILPEYYSFDLEKLRNELDNLRKEFDFRPFQINLEGKQRMTYQGISLTSRPDSTDPEYDSLKLFGYDNQGLAKELDISKVFNKMDSRNPEKEAAWLNEKIFNTPTKALRGYFSEILSKFKCPTTKVRILNLRPNGVLTPHVDFPYYKQIRLHASIYSNPNSWYEVEGEKFNILEDGRFYWFDVGKNHAVWNDGKDDRITLSVNLTVYEDLNGNPCNENKNIIEMIKNCEL